MNSIDFYDLNDVLAVADCREYMTRVLMMTPTSRNGEEWRFNSPLRSDSDSGAFAVTKDKWFDHVEKTGGGIVKLAEVTQKMNTLGAINHLGEAFHCEPRLRKQSKKPKLVKVYQYIDLDGHIVHETLRYEPKTFRQRRPDPNDKTRHVWDLDGIEPILYRLADWADAKTVAIVEGEKDADNCIAAGIPATTSAMGAEKWRNSYNVCFAGKNVVLLPDNDDVGRAHAMLVAWHVRNHAKSVRIVNLPNLETKGDVSDWLEAGGTAKKLLDFVRKTQPVDLAEIEEPKKATETRVLSVAKKANSTPFKNYLDINGVSADGKDITITTPRHVNAMRDDMFKRFWDFPRKIGDVLFDHDRKTREIRYIDAPEQLITWISEKSGHCTEWKHVCGAATKKEFFESVRANVNGEYRYNSISDTPHWPTRSDVYYTHDDLPPPSEHAKYFQQFVDFFSPERGEDEVLIKALICTGLYYKPYVNKPLFIVDSSKAQGNGKSSLVKMVALLFGATMETATTLDEDWSKFTNENQSHQIKRRMMSTEARRKRLFLLDNVDKFFKSSLLASLVTSDVISGIKPYGHDDETRPNDLTYVMTMNGASVDNDLASRALQIFVSMPDDPDPNWEAKVKSFVKAHRLQIISDAISILDDGANFEAKPFTRFRSWERDVLQCVAGSFERYNCLFKTISDRRDNMNDDMLTAREFEQYAKKRAATLVGADIEKPQCYNIANAVLNLWMADFDKDFEKMSNRARANRLLGWIRAGMMADFDLAGVYPSKADHQHRARSCFIYPELRSFGGVCLIRTNSETKKDAFFIE